MLDININKSFRQVNLSFKFTTSQLRTVVLGPSGSGKSSLLKMMAGFYNPDSGYIKYNGTTVFDKSKKQNIASHRRNFGYLPQEYTLFPHMDIRKNILYGMKAHNIPFDQEKFDFVINKTGIATKLDEKPVNLSGGQQQRVALARILMMNPDLLLLDEPFSALDVAIRQCLRDLIVDITDELQLPALFVTHDLDEAYIFAQELVVMDRGEILEYGPRDDVFNRPRFAETAKLMDVKNIIPVGSRKADAVQTLSGMSLNCACVCGCEGESPAAEFLCIRPENIMIIRPDKFMSPDRYENRLEGVITDIHPHGRHVVVRFETTDKLFLIINVPEYAFMKLNLQKQQTISITLRKESLFLCQRKDFAK